jgi:hypothetical protein
MAWDGREGNGTGWQALELNEMGGDGMEWSRIT